MKWCFCCCCWCFLYCYCYYWCNCCCCCWFHKPTFQVWLKLGQEQLRYWWHWVCGGGGGWWWWWWCKVIFMLGWVVAGLGFWQLFVELLKCLLIDKIKSFPRKIFCLSVCALVRLVPRSTSVNKALVLPSNSNTEKSQIRPNLFPWMRKDPEENQPKRVGGPIDKN